MPQDALVEGDGGRVWTVSGDGGLENRNRLVSGLDDNPPISSVGVEDGDTGTRVSDLTTPVGLSSVTRLFVWFSVLLVNV